MLWDSFKLFGPLLRQGLVASPAFSSVYLNPLFAELCEWGLGCHIGGINVEVIGYADDLFLLAQTKDCEQKMNVPGKNME